MRHNMAATSGKSQFQHQVVIGVDEKRAPQEVDFLQMRLAGEITQKAQNTFHRLARGQILRARQNLPLLDIQPSVLLCSRRFSTSTREGDLPLPEMVGGKNWPRDGPGIAGADYQAYGGHANACSPSFPLMSRQEKLRCAGPDTRSGMPGDWRL